jgi:hypothetical protein
MHSNLASGTRTRGAASKTSKLDGLSDVLRGSDATLPPLWRKSMDQNSLAGGKAAAATRGHAASGRHLPYLRRHQKPQMEQ